MPTGTVEVFLIGATGIKDTEVFGKADPYTVLECGKRSLRSNVATNQGSKPVWNQRFSFYIEEGVTELQVKIFNHNIFTDDDQIGSTTIPLARVFSESKLPTTSYNVLRPSGRVQGEVKLSLTFTPKKKPGQTSGNVSGSYSVSSHGPYSSKTHPGPHRQPEPQPEHKHDPLTGPHGYYKNGSGSSSSESGGPPYGSGVGAWANSSTSGSTRPCYSSDSDGSSRPGHGVPMSTDSTQSYQAGMYPGGPSNLERLSAYPCSDGSVPSYPGENIPPSANGSSSHGPVYPHSSSYLPTTSEYAGPYRPPYDYVQHTSGPGEHEGIHRLPSSHYPPPAHDQYFAAAPSQKPRHSTVSQYHLDEVTAGISGMSFSGHASAGTSHDGYRPQSVLPTSLPPTSTYPGESLHVYPGYRLGPANLNERPSTEYPIPGGYPPAGYPREGSSHGNPPGSEYPSGYPPAGYPAASPPPGIYPPPNSFHQGPPSLSNVYPPQAGHPFPGQQDSYPQVPFYHAHPTHYVPAGYPK